LLRSQNVRILMLQTVGAPSQPRSPDDVGPDKFIEVDRSMAGELSRLHHYAVHLGHFAHRTYK